MPNNEKEDFMDLLSLSNNIKQNEENENIGKDKLKTLENLNDDEIQAMVITELLRSIGMNNEVITEVKDMVIMGADASFADAYSKITKSQADMIKALSDIALQKEKLKNQKELKKMDIEGKKDINEHKHELERKDSKATINNNLIVMNREQAFEEVMKLLENDDIIDVD